MYLWPVSDIKYTCNDEFQQNIKLTFQFSYFSVEAKFEREINYGSVNQKPKYGELGFLPKCSGSIEP